MESLKIGFLGGCINNQKGIALEEFYYSVISSLIPDIPHQISAGTYYTFDKMAEKAEVFSQNNNLDVLCLWVRQFPLMPLHKPLIKYENKSGDISWAIHPSFLRLNADWNKELTRYHTQNEYIHKNRKLFEGRDLNLLAGKVLGLHRWARKYINKQIETVQHHCNEASIKLIVISPQQCPSSIMGNDVCKTISVSIDQFCKKFGINFINIIDLGEEYYARDNVHFNATCHKLLANLIYDKVYEIFLEKLEKEKENAREILA